MTKGEERFLKVVDLVNEWAGKSVAWLFIPLTIATTIEVVARYMFNKPTIWVWDVNVMFSVLLVIFSAGYTYLYDAHVRVDILVIRLSKRKRAILDLVTSFLFFFSVGALIHYGWQRGLYSIEVGEYRQSILNPPIAWLRMCVPIAAFLFFMQGVARFIRDFAVARSGGERP